MKDLYVVFYLICRSVLVYATTISPTGRLGMIASHYSMSNDVLTAWNCDFEGVAFIPNGVRHIGKNAFSGCHRVVEVVIPDGVETVGEYAFSACRRLRKVGISDSVTNIESRAFSYCNLLHDIHLPFGLTVLSDGVFIGCSSLGCIRVPDSVQNIRAEAFMGCMALENVTLPTNLVEIGPRAFLCCVRLRELKIPSCTERIGDGAFSGCVNLQVMTLPRRVHSLGDFAFLGCSRLTRLRFLGDAPSDTKLSGVLSETHKDLVVIAFIENYGWPHGGYWPADANEHDRRTLCLLSSLESNSREKAGNYSDYFPHIGINNDSSVCEGVK